MYGTVARMRVKEGSQQDFLRITEEVEGVAVKGMVAVYVYQMDADSREYYMTVLFDSKESYIANAQSPEQHARFLQLMTVLEVEPEWHDGTVVYANT